MQWDGYLSKSFLTPCLLAMLEVDVAEELVPPGSSAVLLGGAGRPPLRPVVDWAVSAIPQRLNSIRRRHIIHRGNIVRAVPSLPRKPTWLPVSLSVYVFPLNNTNTLPLLGNTRSNQARNTEPLYTEGIL